MNHLQSFEGFRSAKSQTASLSKSREEMQSHRRELMDKMAGIRQQISTTRSDDNAVLSDNTVAPVTSSVTGSVDVEMGVPVLVGVDALDAQYESLKQELRQLNRLLG